MKNRHAVVTRWPYAMYQTDLTCNAALWLLYQTNLPIAAIVLNKFTELCSSASIVPNNFKIITQ